MKNTVFVVNGKVVPEVSKTTKRVGENTRMYTVKVCTWAVGCVWWDKWEGFHTIERIDGVNTVLRCESLEEAIGVMLTHRPDKIKEAIGKAELWGDRKVAR